MTPGMDTTQLALLIRDVLMDPETVDKSALLIASSAFLDAANACRVLDWSYRPNKAHWAAVRIASRDYEDHRLTRILAAETASVT